MRRVFLGLYSVAACGLGCSWPTSAIASLAFKVSMPSNSNFLGPASRLHSIGSGVYLGTTASANCGGGLFEYNSNINSLTLKAESSGCGGTLSWPNELTSAGGGLYYGTQFYGGSSGVGGVYEYGGSYDPTFPNTADGNAALRASFNYANGRSSGAALISAGGSIYYGATYAGGDNNLGGIFQFDSASKSITLLASFAGSNGSYPQATLTPAGGGIYYGLTSSGGANGSAGAIYEFNSISNVITLIDSFDVLNGSTPISELTPAGGGIYYGTTFSGGQDGGGGVVYEFNSNTGTITRKASFLNANGRASGWQPHAALTPAGGGIFYGTASNGGANGDGTVFEFNSATGALTALSSFTRSVTGKDPRAPLVAAGGGLFYGTTSAGGANDYGTIYSFTAANPPSSPAVPGPLPVMGLGFAHS